MVRSFPLGLSVEDLLVAHVWHGDLTLSARKRKANTEAYRRYELHLIADKDKRIEYKMRGSLC